MEAIISSPIFAAFAGWLAWTIIMLSVYKDDNESTFNIKAYASEHWDNWLASLVAIPVLLYVGYGKLDLGVVDISNPKWSDLYYLCSGFAVELVKVAWKKWKAKN